MSILAVRKTIIIVIALVLALVVANAIVLHLVRTKVYERELTFVDDTPLDVLRDLNREASTPLPPRDSARLPSLDPSSSSTCSTRMPTAGRTTSA